MERTMRRLGRAVPSLARPQHRSHCRLSWRAFATETRQPQVPYRRDAQGRLLSQVDGAQEPPLRQRSLYDEWTTLAAKFASRPALISKHEPPSGTPSKHGTDTDCLRWTYAELDAHIGALARGLVGKLGIRRGDRVAVLMGNCSTYLALQWALAKVGAIMVPLNPAYAPDELARSLAHVGARTLILVPSLRNASYLDHIERVFPSSRSNASGSTTLPMLEHVVLVDNLSSKPTPAGWARTSALARQGRTFQDVLDSLSPRVVPYDSLLFPSNEALSSDGDGDVGVPLDAKEVINLQLTSGTTGLPKAVALTSYGMLNNGIAIGNVLHLRSDDIVCNNPPLFHCFGLTLGNLAAQTHGGCLLYASETFDPARSLAAVSQEKATVMHGVPAMFFAIMDLLDSLKNNRDSERDVQLDALKLYDQLDISSLRTGLISGASIPVELMSRLLDQLVPGLTSVYGMTESSPVSFGSDAVSTSVWHRAQTVGRVFPHVRAKIVPPLSTTSHHHEDSSRAFDPSAAAQAQLDAERGTPVPINTPGELCTSGYLLMDGYYNDHARTLEVMSEHADEPGVVWLRTGDMAVMDEQGWVKIVGRCKDVIIRGGENLFPATICNCIDEVAGVGQSAVVAVPHERLGETVGAFIKRANDPSGARLRVTDIHDHVKKRLSHQCAPEWIWILGEDGVADVLPKTASGKVQNVVLRAWAKDLSARGVGKVSGR